MKKINSSAPLSDFSGFTLIELLIAIALLVIIGIATSRSIIDSAKLKQSLTTETDFMNEIRFTIAVLEKDIQMHYSGLSMTPPKSGTTSLQAGAALTTDELNQYLQGRATEATEYWSGVIHPSGIRASRFRGTAQAMSFVSASHQSFYREAKESIFIKVLYELRNDNPKKPELMTLYRVIDINPFSIEPTQSKFVRAYPFLRGIKNLKFSYLRADSNDPIKDWDSEQFDGKNVYPQAIQLDLEAVQDQTNRHFDGKFIIKLEGYTNELPTSF